MEVDIHKFQEKSLELIEYYQLVTCDENLFSKTTMNDLKVSWETYIDQNYRPIISYFNYLVKTGSEKMYLLVPLATTVANIERYFDVVSKTHGDSTLEEAKELIPERYLDFNSTVLLYKSLVQQLSKFNNSSK